MANFAVEAAKVRSGQRPACGRKGGSIPVSQKYARRHRDLDLALKECLGDATHASNEREGEPIMTTTHDDTATSWRDLADQLTP